MAETALVLPLVLFLLAATFAVGRVGNVEETLKNAAREGARYASVPAEGTSTLPAVTAVQQRVQQFAAGSGVTLTGSDVSVNQAVTVSEGGLATTFSQVAVTYSYTVSIPLVASLLPTLTLSADATMRNETN